MSFQDLLKGSFLVEKGAFKNWQFIVFIVVLFLFMISRAHDADGKVMQIDSMSLKVKKLKALYIDSGTHLTRMKMESSVRENLRERGLASPTTPPIKIKVTSKD